MKQLMEQMIYFLNNISLLYNESEQADAKK